jgi:hypothetical protein
MLALGPACRQKTSKVHGSDPMTATTMRWLSLPDIHDKLRRANQIIEREGQYGWPVHKGRTLVVKWQFAFRTALMLTLRI